VDGASCIYNFCYSFPKENNYCDVLPRLTSSLSFHLQPSTFQSFQHITMAKDKAKEEEASPPQTLPEATPEVAPAVEATIAATETKAEPVIAKELEEPVKNVADALKESTETTPKSAPEAITHVETKADPLVAQAESQPANVEPKAPIEVPEEAPDPDEDDLSDLDGMFCLNDFCKYPTNKTSRCPR
jgi:hypothetical protein